VALPIDNEKGVGVADSRILVVVESNSAIRMLLSLEQGVMLMQSIDNTGVMRSMLQWHITMPNRDFIPSVRSIH